MHMCALGRVFACIVPMMIAGCGSHGTPGQTTVRSSADKTIEIGIDLPVSGADASTGVPTRNGAVEAIEAAPGPDHRFLHGIIGVEDRTQHPVAVSGERGAMSFEVREIRSHTFNRKL